MNRLRSGRTETTAFNHVILFLLAVFALGPVLVLFLNSVKTSEQIAHNPFSIPAEPRWDNYTVAYERGNYANTVKNSAILTGGTVIGVLIVGGMGGYALAHLEIRGANAIAFYFLVGTAIPIQLYVVPLFFLWKNFGLLNTHLGLIIIYCATSSPFATYLIRSYMVALPKEFIEAAKIDGASKFQVMTQVILPLSWPGFLTTGLIVGLGVWNEFLIAVTFMHQPDLKPVATSLRAFQERFTRDWGLTNAGSVVMRMPEMVLLLLMQRRVIEGWTQGGMKM